LTSLDGRHRREEREAAEVTLQRFLVTSPGEGEQSVQDIIGPRAKLRSLDQVRDYPRHPLLDLGEEQVCIILSTVAPYGIPVRRQSQDAC
jgi:hypothetical protein